MKNIILLYFISLSLLSASEVASTSSTVTVKGQTITILTAPAASAPYYRLAYVTVASGANPGTRLKALVYSKGVTRDEDNLYCATTYTEIQAKAAALGIANLPADPAVGH